MTDPVSVTQEVTASLWLERAEKHNPILPPAGSPMLAALAEEMEEYADRKVAEFARTHPAAAGSVREALEKVQDFLREPDHAEHFGTDQLLEWINRRPTHIIPKLLAAAPTPDAAASEAGEVERLAPEDAWDELVNVDDRTSPEEYPDMCLITRDELIDFMQRAVPGPASKDGAVRALRKALEWALAEIDGKTEYDMIGQRSAALNRARAALTTQGGAEG